MEPSQASTDPVIPFPPKPQEPPRDESRPSFRARVENHPIGLLLGVAVAAITATLAIVAPIAQLTVDNRVAALEAQMEQQSAVHEQQNAAQEAAIQDVRDELEGVRREAAAQLAAEQRKSGARIEELGRSLSSIQRSLGSDTEYYDVGSLVVTPEEAGSLPATSLFYPEDRFYALDASQATGWSYEVTTELRVTAELLGMTEEELREQAGASNVDAWTRFPVHLWRFGGDRSISFLDPQQDTRVNLHPRTEVYVQRVSHDDYVELVTGSLSPSVADAVRATFARDPAGWVLQDQLALEITSAGGLRARIDSLQKKGALAYARVETTLPNVQEGDRELKEYYWSREWLLIAGDDDLYLVKMFVADDDHRSPDYGSMGVWLDAFRVLDS
jgi:hypothetical protein